MYYQDKYLQLIVEVLSEAERVMLLQEEVPYEVVKPYLEIERDPTAKQRLTKIFNNLKAEPNAIELDKKGDRIAFPYNPKGEYTSDIEKEINDYISKYNFVVKDYIKGIAFDKKNQRDIKIGKILTLVAKKEKEDSSKKKGEDLFSRFTNDPKRAQAKKASFLIVFTKDKYDIATMSTDRRWGSCMDILSVGEHTHHVKSDIKEGTFVAYIIESTDTNIEKPLGRISIKPYIRVDKDREVSDSIESGDEVVNYAEYKTYGNIPGGKEKFIDFVDDIMQKVQKISGEYKRLGCLYSDSDRHGFTDRTVSNKKADSAIEKGEKLPEKIFKNLGREYKEKYIDSRLNNNNFLSNYEFELATDKQKKKSLDIMIENGISLSENYFEIATDKQKQESINIKLNNNESLYYFEFGEATYQQKKKSIDIILDEESVMDDYVFAFATEEQQEKYINIIINDENYFPLTKEQFEEATEEQKKKYIDKKLDKGQSLRKHELEVATEEQKEKAKLKGLSGD
jgi:hypothetical protein